MGRDQLPASSLNFIKGFNPHARVGRDNMSQLFLVPDDPCFNPHARVGRDSDFDGGSFRL